MNHPYSEMYLNDAMRNLGEAFDYAVCSCGFGLSEFANLFIVTGYAEQFGQGNPKIVAGMSGVEMVMNIAAKAGLSRALPAPQVRYDCSPEYWCGWIVAYYQWRTGRGFREIWEDLTPEDVYRLYGTLHEASEERFCDAADAIIERKRKDRETHLQRQRKRLGYYQRELAEISGVNLRTLQQYELGTKDINKASVGTLVALSRALGCSVTDIME